MVQLDLVDYATTKEEIQLWSDYSGRIFSK